MCYHPGNLLESLFFMLLNILSVCPEGADLYDNFVFEIVLRHQGLEKGELAKMEIVLVLVVWRPVGIDSSLPSSPLYKI